MDRQDCAPVPVGLSQPRCVLSQTNLRGEITVHTRFLWGMRPLTLPKNTGADVTFRDSIALFRRATIAIFSYLKEERFDIIFIESATPSWQHDRAIIAAISEVLPDAEMVVAGPIAANEDTAFKAKSVKAIIKGEYEKGAVKVIAGADGVFTHDLL